jgi:hypothetical protein
VLDSGAIDVEEIATALADQTDYELRWLLDPRTGRVAFWTSDTGIDGQNPVEMDELDLIPIDPIPSYISRSRSRASGIPSWTSPPVPCR